MDPRADGKLQLVGPLKKKLSDALGKLNHLTFEQKQKAWELLEQFLNPKAEKSVTLSP